MSEGNDGGSTVRKSHSGKQRKVGGPITVNVPKDPHICKRECSVRIDAVMADSYT